MKKLFIICLSIIAVSCNNDDEAGNININCTEVFVSGLSVTVKDALTDATLTNDIIVTATEGDYAETLTLVDDTFIGAGERAGTYTITATGTGYMTSTVNEIVVGEDECHVITEQITIALTPN